MGRIEIEAPERFYAVDFSASLVEDSEADLFRAGLLHPLPTELASVGSTRLRGQGVDKSGVVTLTKSGQACPLDFGAKTQPITKMTSTTPTMHQRSAHQNERIIHAWWLSKNSS